MRRNFRRSRKFWHCDKDELATRLSIGSATPLSPFLSLSFVFLGYLCSCLLQHYLPVVVAVLVVLVLAAASGHLFPHAISLPRTAPFSLFAVATPNTRSPFRNLCTHKLKARRVQEKWVKTRKAAHTKKSTKEKQQRNGKLGCIARIAAVAISTECSTIVEKQPVKMPSSSSRLGLSAHCVEVLVGSAKYTVKASCGPSLMGPSVDPGLQCRARSAAIKVKYAR